jgi:hypothetical protein
MKQTIQSDYLSEDNHSTILNEIAITEKWHRLGFLHGLEDHQKINVAMGYEVVKNYLLDPINKDKYPTIIETISFPVVRKILVRYNYYVTCSKQFKDYIITFLEDFTTKYLKEAKSFVNGDRDMEAEFCSDYANNYKSYYPM